MGICNSCHYHIKNNDKPCKCGHNGDQHNCYNHACTKCECGWF